MCSNRNTAGKNGKLKTQVQKTNLGAPGTGLPTLIQLYILREFRPHGTVPERGSHLLAWSGENSNMLKPMTFRSSRPHSARMIPLDE